MDIISALIATISIFALFFCCPILIYKKIILKDALVEKNKAIIISLIWIFICCIAYYVCFQTFPGLLWPTVSYFVDLYILFKKGYQPKEKKLLKEIEQILNELLKDKPPLYLVCQHEIFSTCQAISAKGIGELQTCSDEIIECIAYKTILQATNSLLTAKDFKQPSGVLTEAGKTLLSINESCSQFLERSEEDATQQDTHFDNHPTNHLSPDVNPESCDNPNSDESPDFSKPNGTPNGYGNIFFIGGLVAILAAGATIKILLNFTVEGISTSPFLAILLWSIAGSLMLWGRNRTLKNSIRPVHMTIDDTMHISHVKQNILSHTNCEVIDRQNSKEGKLNAHTAFRMILFITFIAMFILGCWLIFNSVDISINRIQNGYENKNNWSTEMTIFMIERYQSSAIICGAILSVLSTIGFIATYLISIQRRNPK